MPLTLGSVGDIISLVLLVNRVLMALNDGRGSSAEYQEITRELIILDRVLLEVEQLAREHASTPELAALLQTAQECVANCQTSLKLFLERFEKYEGSLGDSSNMNSLVKIVRKVQFAV